MAVKDIFDFNCPQFVDFCSDVDFDPTKTEVLGGFSPDFPVPVCNKKKKGTTISSKTSKFITPVNKSRVTTFYRPRNKTGSKKTCEKVLTKRLSKSDGSLSTIMRNLKSVTLNDRRSYFPNKRSLSENDVRIKKKTYPTTPMCLKRTLCKVKTKIIKTSEELELDIIAELQKQTLQHLRANEIAMNRIKQKLPIPNGLPKAPIRNRDFRKTTFQVKDRVGIMEEINAYVNNVRASSSVKTRATVMSRLPCDVKTKTESTIDARPKSVSIKKFSEILPIKQKNDTDVKSSKSHTNSKQSETPISNLKNAYKSKNNGMFDQTQLSKSLYVHPRNGNKENTRSRETFHFQAKLKR